MIRLGYPAQNLTIPATTNRTLRLASLGDVQKVKALVEANLDGLRTIIAWNRAHGMELFRIGQGLIPFASHPEFPYDWEKEHGAAIRELGREARAAGARLSMHPGQFIQPGSPKPHVVEASLAELRYVTRLLDLLGSPDATLVLHMGGVYDDRQAAIDRFVAQLQLEPALLRYLALENDERLWTVVEIVEIAMALGVPAITDTLHHAINSGGCSLREAIGRSLPTWAARGVRPKLHLSSQDPAKQPGAHASGIDPSDWEAMVEAVDGREVDVMVEAKGKEQAVLPLLPRAGRA